MNRIHAHQEADTVRQAPCGTDRSLFVAERFQRAGERFPIPREHQPAAGDWFPIAREHQPNAGEQKPIAGKQFLFGREQKPIARNCFLRGDAAALTQPANAIPEHKNKTVSQQRTAA